MKAIIFDTETTGLIESRKIPLDRQPEIIEFYGRYVDLKTGKKLDELEMLIKPKHVKNKKLEPIIEKITGLNYQRDLIDKLDYSDWSKDIQEFFSQSDCAIAHNMGYDKEMIEIEQERVGVEFVWPERLTCTIEQTMHLQGYRLNLNKLHTKLFNEGFPNAHRARNDVEALTKCCVKLHEMGVI
jgi:DNA polymerase III alpha subunit (gram-positive type)